MASVYNPSLSPIKPKASTNGMTSYGVGSAALCCRSRTSELLSCAKTIVKVEKSRHSSEEMQSTQSAQWWMINPADLRLYDTLSDAAQPQHQVLEDGVSLLRTMDAELQQLEALVRRRGQTNDPTQEITMAVNRLQTDTSQLTVLIQTMIPAGIRQSNKQRTRHWQMLQQWFQSAMQKQGERLKEILKVRGTVLKEQARRRGRFKAGTTTTSASAATTSPTRTNKTAAAVAAASKKKLDGPLITRPIQKPPPPPARVVAPASVPLHAAANGGAGMSSAAAAPARTTPLRPHPNSAPLAATMATNGGGGTSSYYGNNAAATGRGGAGGGYGGGYGGGAGGYGGGAGYGGAGGYGGGSSMSRHNPYGSSTGMRQRRTAVQEQDQQQQQHQDDFQQQMLQRQQERQTIQRVQEARQAEKSLAALGTLFGKMTTLIKSQEEVVDKLEDDVEAAFVDVSAGHKEIQTVYSLKKGNRALILKVFGLLIFFIIFMKAYSK